MLLEVQKLSKTFRSSGVRAVRDVSFGIQKGEVLGIVGESGSGKSTLLKVLLRLLKEDNGQIVFEGQDITKASKQRMKWYRSKTQIIFQDPYLSLDPRMKIRSVLEEPFLITGHRHSFHLEIKLHDLMKCVGLPLDYLEKTARQLSGGECQRVAIARALSLDPELLICDEPVSSLDVLVRAQILNLFLSIHKKKRMSILFVSHDLRVIRHICDRIIVMKDGQIVEQAKTDEFFRSPKQPYSLQLLAASRHKA